MILCGRACPETKGVTQHALAFPWECKAAMLLGLSSCSGLLARSSGPPVTPAPGVPPLAMVSIMKSQFFLDLSPGLWNPVMSLPGKLTPGIDPGQSALRVPGIFSAQPNTPTELVSNSTKGIRESHS